MKMKISNKLTGRPGKLNEAIIDKISKSVKNGLSFKDATFLAGVGESTFYKWQEKGQKAKAGIYREFVDKLEEAKLQGKQTHLNLLNRAAMGYEYDELTYEVDGKGVEKLVKRVRKTVKGDPSCTKWILEKRHPEEFGSRLTLSTDAPITTVELVVSGENIRSKIDAMNGDIMDAPDVI
jgi:transposase